MTLLEKQIFDLVRSELKPEFVPSMDKNRIDSKYCGHCHHATIAMYNLLDGKVCGYKVRKAIDELEIKHYWLESPSGEVIDPTAEQYTDLNRPLPYNERVSKGISYLKSNIAKRIIATVQHKLQQA